MDNDVFEKLAALQDIIAERNELEAEIDDAPHALSTRKQLLERLKSGYIEKNSEYEELRNSIAGLKAYFLRRNAKGKSPKKRWIP